MLRAGQAAARESTCGRAARRSRTKGTSAAAPATRSPGRSSSSSADDGVNPLVDVSRLFIYYNERVIEHTVQEDSGAMIRDGIKTLVKQGVCSERRWPYVIAKFAKKPDAACYKEARDHQVTAYARLEIRRRDASLPRRRLPVRLRLLGVRELRVRNGSENGRGADAEANREAARRSRGAGCRLRRRQEALPGAQLVGNPAGA